MQFSVAVARYWTVMTGRGPVLTFAAYDRDEAADVVRRLQFEKPLSKRFTATGPPGDGTSKVWFRHATQAETQEWLDAAQDFVQRGQDPAIACIEDLWDANWGARL